MTIEVTNFADDIINSGTISSDSLNFILTDSFDSSSNFFPGFNNFSDLAITTKGTFTNNHTIGLDGNLTITADTFTNNATINPTGNLTIAADTFLNAASATINADSFNVTVGNDFSNQSSSTIDADTVTIEVTNFDNDIANTGTVLSDSLNFILTDDFTRSSTSFNGFTFNNLGITTAGYFI